MLVNSYVNFLEDSNVYSNTGFIPIYWHGYNDFNDYVYSKAVALLIFS